MTSRKKFLLRISPELWEELNQWAADEFRSVNSQIEYLLHRAVQSRRKSKREFPGNAEGRPGRQH